MIALAVEWDTDFACMIGGVFFGALWGWAWLVVVEVLVSAKSVSGCLMLLMYMLVGCPYLIQLWQRVFLLFEYIL